MKFEDFVRIGQQLKMLNEQLVDYTVKKSQTCKKSGPVIKLVDKAMKELDRLRSDLEDLMYLEHRESINLFVSQTHTDGALIFFGPDKSVFNVEKRVWEHESKR
jgi:hypothetical protein